MISVLVHIVTFNHAAVLERALSALKASRAVAIEIHVTDNASADDCAAIARRSAVAVHSSVANLGFCAGHNSIIAFFLASHHTHLCILNPDVAVTPNCINELAARCTLIATPKLLRGDAKLVACSPPQLDAAGMLLTRTLRHFDRGSQQPDGPRFAREELVFGGTGACLMLSRAAVESLLLPDTPFDAVIDRIHPGTSSSEPRKKLFDEAFFAYREDAELAWRAQRFGLSCRYVPSAIAVHKRAVLPENRVSLPSFVNYLGVRNRFLLQLSHFSYAYRSALLPGFLMRNLTVLLAVVVRERTSRRALRDLFLLRKRACFLRRWIGQRATVRDVTVARWLNQESELC